MVHWHIGSLVLTSLPVSQFPSFPVSQSTSFPIYQFTGFPPINVRIGDEEAVDVPQGDQELAAHFVGAVVAEEQIVLRLVGAVQPAHHVHAHFVGGLVELDGVAPGLVHLPSILGQQRGVAKAGQERRAVLHHRGHGQQAVEPVAKLAGKGLTDPVGRIPGAPVVRIAAVLQRAEGDDAGVQPGAAHVGDARNGSAAVRAGDLDRIYPRAVRRVSFQLLPAGDGPLPQLVLVADDLEVTALLAFPDGQRQAPVALLGDHPVVHVAQPVQLPLQPEGGDPADLPRDVHDVVAQLVHGDEPLVHQPEDELGAAAPADRIAVRVVFYAVEQPFLLQILEDGPGRRGGAQARQPGEALHEDALVVQGHDDGQPVLLAQLEVLSAAAGGDVHDARALGLAHAIPEDDAVRLGGRRFNAFDKSVQVRVSAGFSLRRQLVEGAVVRPTLHGAALQLRQHLVAAPQHPHRAFGEVEDLVALPDLDVVQVGADGSGDVGSQRPGRRRPDEERFSLPPAQREAQRDAGVRQLHVAVGDDLVLRDAGGAARAPGHYVGVLVEPALLPAALEEGPDHVVVLVGQGEVGAAQFGQAQPGDDALHAVGDRPLRPRHGDHGVGIFRQSVGQLAQRLGIVPVHPVAQADGLCGLHGGVAQHPLLAAAHEAGHAVLLDVLLGAEAQIPLHLHLHPEALAVEAVLVAGAMAAHHLVAVEDVFVRAAPAVVHAHGVVGSDGAVYERPRRRVRAQRHQLVEGLGLLPEAQHVVLLGHEIHFGGYVLKHDSSPLTMTGDERRRTKDERRICLRHWSSVVRPIPRR